MKLFNKDLDKEILYIAEIGVNHEGNINRCLKLIKDAKKAGADVVKFQCFTPKNYVSIYEKKYKIIKKFFFDEVTFTKIINYCKKIKINFLFTPVSHDWINFIKKNSSVIKIASGDLNFNFLIKKIVEQNFNIILSTGISDFKEIKKTYNLIKKKYNDKTKNKLVLLHCVSSYPVNDFDANLRSISYLKKKFNITVGYSNHVNGINACLGAITLGAKVIEFHFTDNKKRKFRDHKLSLNVSEVRDLIKRGNNLKLMLGKYEKKICKRIIKDKKTLSKGIIANNDLERGDILSKENLSFARPAKFLHANQANKIIGKKLKTKILAGSLLKLKDFN